MLNKKLLKNLSGSFVIVSMLGLNFCATSQKAVPEKKPSKSNSQKATQAESKTDAKAQKKVVAKMHTINPTEELVAWTLKKGSAENLFTIKDRQYVASMPVSPKSGSLAEAAAVIGVLRDIMTPPGASSGQFQQVDSLDKNQNEKADTSVVQTSTLNPSVANSLESRCREKGLDLVSAISTNSILKTSTVYTWVWNASLMDGNSEPFKQNITTALKAEAILWQEVSRKVGVIPEANVGVAVPVSTTQPDGSSAPSVPSPSPTLDAAAPTPPPAPTMSEIEVGKIIGAAQEAAVSENFEKAVSEIAKVPSTSANFEIAQENMKQWSNRAVTDLRKKAAFEYRSASSMTDNSAKKSGLIKAKSFLETALKKFTAASNLDTVRDNLKMIDQELEKLP